MRWCCSGKRDEGLLDSYEAERKPHVRTLVALAKQFGEIIGELDPAAARVRDATLRGQLERGETETVRQRFIPGLSAGVIDTEPRASPAVRHVVCSAAGIARPTSPQRGGQGGVAVLLDDALQDRFLIATVDEAAQGWLSPRSLELWRRIARRAGRHCARTPPARHGRDQRDVRIRVS